VISSNELFRTKLLASVAPLVNNTSSGRAPTSFATSSRAWSTAAFAVLPNKWSMEAAFPNEARMKGNIASMTSGRHGVVAA
jgi:hypothetical protein